MTVNELRSCGIKVRVCHHRRLRVGIPVMNPENGGREVDFYMTRHEFHKESDRYNEFAEKVAANPLLSVIGAGAFAEMINISKIESWGTEVATTGGFTSVELTFPDGHTAKAKRNFKKNENYNRRIGVKACLGKLANDIAEHVKVAV